MEREKTLGSDRQVPIHKRRDRTAFFLLSKHTPTRALAQDPSTLLSLVFSLSV